MPKELPLSALETHLGYWLRRVSNRVSGAFAQALHAKQVSVAEWVMLRHLSGTGRDNSRGACGSPGNDAWCHL